MKSVRRVLLLAIAMVMTLIPAAPGGADSHQSLEITGVVDGPLSGGIPKAIELTALADIPDLSVYGVESANNGAAAVAPEFTFPADSLSTGDVVYLASESTGFETFFCATPEYTGSVANINGDDAIVLYSGDAIVDVFGDVGTDGSGQAWEYLDGWAKRDDGTGPDGSTFVLANWTFSGPNALDGETRNDLAATPYPFEGVSDCSEPEPEITKIHAIQGSGAESPLLGERVIIEGIVVGDFETFDGLAGFFVQEEDSDADSDLLTSEGMFVFNFSNDSVNLGDLVQVEGTVDERRGASFDQATFTQLTNFVDVQVISSGNALPALTQVNFPLTSVGDLEAVEGMRVELPQTLSIIEYFNFDRFGETVVGLPRTGEDRHYQPTAVFEPGSTDAEDLASYNSRSRITIDDNRTASNPDPAIHPGNGEVFDLTNRFNGGDTIRGVQGVVHHTFNLYRVMPTQYGEYVAANPRDLEPQDVGGDLKIGTLNALNYFSTVDTGDPICGPNLDQGCRGADDENERQRQLTKLTEALIGMDADIVGLIELENTFGVEPLEDIVDSLNDQLGKNTYRYVRAGENSVVGTDVIKVGIIYKKATVVPNEDPAILDDPSFLDPRNLGDDKNRAALAQTFNQKGTGEKVTVVVNHLKSKGSPCGPGDDDPEQGSCNLTRTLAAQELLDWIATDPTGTGDPDFLILGDLNSYDKEDPIDALRLGGYADLLADYQGELAYSYVFSGQFGYLDYGMSSATLTPQVTGATSWHINSDEPDILDYDTSFKKDAQDALFEENAFRSSDHDAVIIGLDLNRKLGR